MRGDAAIHVFAAAGGREVVDGGGGGILRFGQVGGEGVRGGDMR